MGHHPTEDAHAENLLKWFSYDHLPEDLQRVSAPFRDLAAYMLRTIPGGSAERTAGLRKLLEAKDCMVRAAVEWHDL